MEGQPTDEDLDEDRLVYLATGLASSCAEQRQEACIAYLGSRFASRVRRHCAFRLGITGEWDIWDTQVDVMLALRRVPESRRCTQLRGARGMRFVLRRARWSAIDLWRRPGSISIDNEDLERVPDDHGGDFLQQESAEMLRKYLQLIMNLLPPGLEREIALMDLKSLITTGAIPDAHMLARRLGRSAGCCYQARCSGRAHLRRFSSGCEW